MSRVSTDTNIKQQTSIRLENVSVEFDGKPVLRDINLSVKQGEFIALIGPSGGGKSTLLRVISGLIEAKGSVSVNCKPAVIFQDYRLLPWRTVRENVALPKELTGRGDAAEDVLKQVGMQMHADRYPHQLSGGMRARVAIARALAQDSEVLLMDEPFAALDALVRERFNLEMKRLHEKTKKTIIFVTHSIREAVYLADRVVVLKDGRIDTILDSHNEGRITAYDDGIEAILRARLGMADSTLVNTGRSRFRFPWEILGVIALTALVFLLWSIFSTRVNPLFFPPPQNVWQALVDNASYLIPNTLATLRIMALGVLTAIMIGVPIGYAMGKRLTLERLLSPFIVALQAIPIAILAPLLVIWMGYGMGARVLTTALISMFPLMVSTMVGVREVDRTYREVFTTMGSTVWGTLFKLDFPGALPVVLGGLRLTVTLALIGTVVSEFIFGGYGLGYFANTERLNFRYANAVAAVGVNVALGLFFYLMVTLLEQWVLRYRKA
jgi:NitT/TauT family transport system ATP-binding protein